MSTGHRLHSAECWGVRPCFQGSQGPQEVGGPSLGQMDPGMCLPPGLGHQLPVSSPVNKVIAELLHRPLSVYNYKDVYKMFIDEAFRRDRVFPVVLPNWDTTPRRGAGAYILHDAKPEYFQKLTERVLEMIKDKKEEDKIVFIKSWNEWGEGNYMEPDLTYGHGYINALKNALLK